jgi:hypothetical protein
MGNERVNKILNKSAKVSLSLSLSAGSMACLPLSSEASALTPQANKVSNFLFEARGLIRCENDVPVNGVKIESIRDSGVADFYRIVGTAVYAFSKGTNDPFYDVRVECGNINNWAQADYSHIVSVDGPKDFLCYNEPNLHGLPQGRCELYPALGSYSVATS